MQNNLARRIWLDGRLYVSNVLIAKIPFHVIRLLWYRRVLKAEIGEGSSVYMNAWFDTPGGFSMGKNSTVNRGCRLDSRGGLRIGNNVSISAEVSLLTADHDPKSESFAGRSAPVDIGDHVFIGTRAMILPGVTVGEGAIIAAGSVVTSDVESFSIVAGVPARPIGQRNPALNYHAQYRRLFQ